MNRETASNNDNKRCFISHIIPDREIPSLADDVTQGLLSKPRSLPPKYFYDEIGCALFDAICTTPEYYLTRSESSLLETYATDIICQAQPEHIIEFGSGNSHKTCYLLDACEKNGYTCNYWPFDVSELALRDASQRLVNQYAWLRIVALVGDYAYSLAQLPKLEGRKLFMFLGSTIGNFSEQHTLKFIQEIRAHMSNGDCFLLGADRVKDGSVLHAAYNDAAGITADFNLNVLSVLNRKLHADFKLDSFEHLALYDEDKQQIEMYLVAREAQQVQLRELDAELQLEKGERILTEISRKFTADDLHELLQNAGLTITSHLEAENGYYSLIMATLAPC